MKNYDQSIMLKLQSNRLNFDYAILNVWKVERKKN